MRCWGQEERATQLEQTIEIEKINQKKLLAKEGTLKKIARLEQTIKIKQGLPK